MYGAALDSDGISSVAWSNSRGGSGTATGTTSWSQSNLTLYQGLNVVTLTVTDNDSNETVYTVSITADIQRTWVRH